MLGLFRSPSISTWLLTKTPVLTMWFYLRLALFLLLCTNVIGHKLRGCFSDEELASIRPRTILRRSIRHAELRRFGDAPAQSCSDFKLLPFSPELRNRALSPWRSEIKIDHSMIPSVYEEAECLCTGCIINGVSENTDYNSVPIKQTFMFLKKVTCPTNPQKYSLKVVYKEVPVACTCVVPKQ